MVLGRGSLYAVTDEARLEVDRAVYASEAPASFLPLMKKGIIR
jgi:hypothetical protein